MALRKALQGTVMDVSSVQVMWLVTLLLWLRNGIIHV